MNWGLNAPTLKVNLQPKKKPLDLPKKTDVFIVDVHFIIVNESAFIKRDIIVEKEEEVIRITHSLRRTHW